MLLNLGKITMFTNRPENVCFGRRMFTAVLAGKN
jgi:hypothetical protein